jgi:hypothetical protein
MRSGGTSEQIRRTESYSARPPHLVPGRDGRFLEPQSMPKYVDLTMLPATFVCRLPLRASEMLMSSCPEIALLLDHTSVCGNISGFRML